MHEPTYREAMRTAWQITTKHKFLLIFGLFALFVGQLGLLDLVMKIGMVGSDSAAMPLWAILPAIGGMGTVTVAGFTFQTWVLIAWLTAIIVGFVGFLTFVSIASHGALIHATGQYVRHPRKEVSIDSAWHTGVTHFWRLFAVVFIKKLVLALLAFITGMAVLNAVTYASTGDALLFFFLFVLALVVGMVVSFIAVYAAGYIVLEEYGVKESIIAAWELFREHWLVSVEVGLTVLVLNVVAALIAIASLSLLFIPTILLWGVASSAVSSVILFQVGSFLAMGLFIFTLATIGSWLTVFTTALWMDLFQHMHRRGMVSCVIRRFIRI